MKSLFEISNVQLDSHQIMNVKRYLFLVFVYLKCNIRYPKDNAFVTNYLETYHDIFWKQLALHHAISRKSYSMGTKRMDRR